MSKYYMEFKSTKKYSLITNKEAIINIFNSINQVTPLVISNCWKKSTLISGHQDLTSVYDSNPEYLTTNDNNNDNNKDERVKKYLINNLGLQKEDMDRLEEDESSIAKNPPYYEEEDVRDFWPDDNSQPRDEENEEYIDNDRYEELVGLEKGLSKDLKRLNELDMLKTKKILSY